MRTILLGNACPRVKSRVPFASSDPEEILAEGQRRGMSPTALGFLIGEHGAKAAAEAVAERLVETAKWDGPECTTTIQVSPESTLLQAVHECEKAWRKSAHGSPTWIAGNDPGLVALLVEQLGGNIPMREFQPGE